MNTIYDGTTPTFVLTFQDDPLLYAAKSIAVTISTDYHQKLFELTRASLTIGENTISFSLTQKQTYMLAKHSKDILIQVNILYQDGTRVCSKIAKVSFEKNLKREVMV